MSLDVIHLKSPIGSLVVRPAVWVDRDITLVAASRVMMARNVSALLVGQHGEAIVTERDLARAAARGRRPNDSIESIATFQPITVSASTPVVEAAALMLNEDVRHLVIDLGSGGIGVVSLRAIMAALLQASDPQVWLESLRLSVHVSAADSWIG